VTPPPTAGARTRRRRPARGLWLALLAILAVVVVLILATVRYGPVLGDIRALRDSASRLAAEAGALEPQDVDRVTLQRLGQGVEEVEAHLAPLRELMDGDPLIGLMRGVPLVRTQIGSADHLVAAGDSIVEAGRTGLGLADRLVSLREANDADPSRPLMPALVELMATSTEDVDRIDGLLDEARGQLRAIPPDAVAQIRDARDLMAGPLERYAPLLDTYRELDDVLPGMLGWGGDRRYLVMALNPAELRPAGGYSGTIGVIGLRDGAIEELSFQDVYELDLRPGLPHIEPPEELRDHLLGEGQSWRLADAAWSPDFPSAARKALEFYEIQTGDGDFDGVIAVTTFAFDRLLEVIGAVEIEEYDVTVQPGEVTMTLLGETRGTPTSTEGRKDILDALARTAMQRLLAVPPEQWSGLLAAVADIGRQQHALAWFRGEEPQRLAVESGWSGALRADEADHLYVVESNVAPTSKYNLVVDRADSLVVTLARDGDALESLRLDWQNRGGEPGEPYASLRRFSNNPEGWYGSYLRVLVPPRSELVTANGRAADAIRGAERVAEEDGRTVFANYLFMPPGESTMTYFWSTPGAAQQEEDGWEYRLVVQKQPGARPHSLTVRVDLPDGATVTEASEGAVVSDDAVRLETTLETDVELWIRYTLPGEPAR
jgi:hypothetical protein